MIESFSVLFSPTLQILPSKIHQERKQREDPDFSEKRMMMIMRKEYVSHTVKEYKREDEYHKRIG